MNRQRIEGREEVHHTKWFVHVPDPESPVGALLRDATSALPKGVVDWYSGRSVAASLK